MSIFVILFILLRVTSTFRTVAYGILIISAIIVAIPNALFVVAYVGAKVDKPEIVGATTIFGTMILGCLYIIPLSGSWSLSWQIVLSIFPIWSVYGLLNIFNLYDANAWELDWSELMNSGVGCRSYVPECTDINS